MYSNLSKWFATTSSIWGNGARISMAIGRRPTDIKHIADSFTQPPMGEQGYYDLKCETTNEVKTSAANALTYD